MMRFGLSECEQERVWKLWGTGLALRAVARYVVAGWASDATPHSRVAARRD